MNLTSVFKKSAIGAAASAGVLVGIVGMYQVSHYCAEGMKVVAEQVHNGLYKTKGFFY